MHFYSAFAYLFKPQCIVVWLRPHYFSKHMPSISYLSTAQLPNNKVDSNRHLSEGQRPLEDANTQYYKAMVKPPPFKEMSTMKVGWLVFFLVALNLPSSFCSTKYLGHIFCNDTQSDGWKCNDPKGGAGACKNQGAFK